MLLVHKTTKVQCESRHFFQSKQSVNLIEVDVYELLYYMMTFEWGLVISGNEFTL